jgi:hypothetical protein
MKLRIASNGHIPANVNGTDYCIGMLPIMTNDSKTPPFVVFKQKILKL